MIMKIIDVDELFENYVKQFMKENAGKFTEEEWEDKIPELYEDFGSRPQGVLGGKSPRQYYKGFGGKALCALLSKHVEEEVPVSEYLLDALVEGDTEEGLLEFLKVGTDEELMSYAVNILNDKACFRALPVYIDYIIDDKTDENMRELMGGIIIENAREVKKELMAAIGRAGKGKPIIAEALANCPKDKKISDFLFGEFLRAKGKDISPYAHMLVKYGDEEALPLLEKRIEEPALRYSDFIELKYAIEALGGEYSGERDFSSDPSYRKIKSGKK